MVETLQLATEKFETAQGKIVDVLYGVPDGRLFYTPEEAAAISEDITTYYRDAEVREMAKHYKELEKMVFVTDYIKRSKVKKLHPVYAEYLDYTDKMGYQPVTEEIFKFVQLKVYTSTRPIVPGQKANIFMYKFGIVSAIFLRRYSQGQIWQVGDNLVLTCPTNTELMSGTYQSIFSPLLGK